MTTTTTNDKIRITMSERRPLSILKAEWPIIACADWHNGQHKSQANTVRFIRVRQHADGRRLVYGVQEAGDGGQHVGTRNPEGGFLLPMLTEGTPDEEGTIRAIRRVGGILDDAELADECIADLPAEELSPTQRRLSCVSNEGYPASLETGKVYVAREDRAAERLGLLRVVDDSGEDYLYPASLFAEVQS